MKTMLIRCGESLACTGKSSKRGMTRLPAWIVGLAFATVLTACGGGSSGGAGSGEISEDPAPAGGGSAGNALAGTYNGFATITLSAPGLPPDTFTGTIRLVIDAQGNVVSDPGTQASGTGRLNGNTFTVTVPGSRFNDSDLSCGGSVLIRGTVSGDTIDGTISGSNFSCNGIPIQLNGTYSATRVSSGQASRASATGTAMAGVQQAVKTSR